ncbi:MAG: FAD-dependent oxidoreductase [bacterium]|jgi:hypothetical protein
MIVRKNSLFLLMAATLLLLIAVLSAAPDFLPIPEQWRRRGAAVPEAPPAYDLVTDEGRAAVLRALLAGRKDGIPLLPASGDEYDILVYGATSAGVTAAIQAARMGKSVVLIAAGEHVGGVTSSGLGATDINRASAIGGIAREFYQLIYLYYSVPGVWTRETKDDYFLTLGTDFWGGRNDSLRMMWMFEPQAAQLVFHFMLQAAGVNVVPCERLDRGSGVVKEGRRITAVRMESGRTFRAGMFIDATYEGDLMAASGTNYTTGREANTAYGETVNGIRNGVLVPVDPYRQLGEPASGLLPFIEAVPPGREGEGDHRIQAYTYRFTLSNDKASQLPITKPDSYDPFLYEILARRFATEPSLALNDVLVLTPLPNRKTDTNHADFIGANYSWPEGDYETREEIAAAHREYILGLLWFLANDERVPAAVREEMGAWGLAADEYMDNANFPPQIYVREGRRMVSDYVLTEHDVRGTRAAADGVGLGTYWLDPHIVSRYRAADGTLREEGKVWDSEGVYPVSYRAIIPPATGETNLLVPVALSASHAAYGSLRMEPVFMVLGQSAATAAVMALERRCPAQSVPYPSLRAALLRDGQILDPLAARAPNGLDVSLAPYMNVLARLGAIAEPEYWLAAAEDGQSFRADKVAEMMITLARQWEPADDLAAAAGILQKAGIIGTPGYWLDTAGQGIDPDRQYVIKVLIDAAAALR